MKIRCSFSCWVIGYTSAARQSEGGGEKSRRFQLLGDWLY